MTIDELIQDATRRMDRSVESAHGEHVGTIIAGSAGGDRGGGGLGEPGGSPEMTRIIASNDQEGD